MISAQNVEMSVATNSSSHDSLISPGQSNSIKVIILFSGFWLTADLLLF